MKEKRRDRITLWRDTSLPDGLELLRAVCFDHAYPAHFHDEYVIAAFAGCAQRHRILRSTGIATAGTVMIISPGEVHTGEAVERMHGWQYCALYPSARFMDSIADDVLGRGGPLHFGSQALRYEPAIADRLLRSSAAMQDTTDILERQCLAYEALADVVGRLGRRGSILSRARAVRSDIGHATAYLQAHYASAVDIRDVAAVCNLSEFHFMRTFRTTTGLSVHRYLTQIRLDRARDLLSRGISAAETAVSVGFFDQSHLIRQFRTNLGVTPGQYAAACL